MLIQKGADVNVVGQNGNTALIWAAENGLDTIAQILIGKGANANATNNNGNSALFSAAMTGNQSSMHQKVSNKSKHYSSDHFLFGKRATAMLSVDVITYTIIICS